MAAGEKQRQKARTLMTSVFPKWFLETSLPEEIFPVQPFQSTVSTLSANRLLSLQPHLPQLWLWDKRRGPSSWTCTQSTFTCLPPSQSGWTDVMDRSNCWELTASHSPTETKGSNEYSNWAGTPRGEGPIAGGHTRAPGNLYHLIHVCPALGSLSIVSQDTASGVPPMSCETILPVCVPWLAQHCPILEAFHVSIHFLTRVGSAWIGDGSA